MGIETNWMAMVMALMVVYAAIILIGVIYRSKRS